MTDTAPAVRHILMVSLRGQDHCVSVPMKDEAHARTTVAWCATELLRKSPADRAVAWMLGVAGENVKITATGIEATPTFAPIAAFDPREVVAVVYVVQKEGEKWE